MLPQTQTREIAREEAELTVSEIRANLALADSLRLDAKMLRRTLPRCSGDMVLYAHRSKQLAKLEMVIRACEQSTLGCDVSRRTVRAYREGVL